jgi:hypothetical protein
MTQGPLYRSLSSAIIHLHQERFGPERPKLPTGEGEIPRWLDRSNPIDVRGRMVANGNLSKLLLEPQGTGASLGFLVCQTQH